MEKVMPEKSLIDQINDELGSLQLAFLKKARAAVEGELGFALLAGTGQTSTLQISGQAGRTQTETSHTDDMNAIERMKVSVGRGSDDNQVVAGAINAGVAMITQAGSFGLSSMMIGSSVANNQINANVVDANHKNSNFGRGYGVFGLLAVGDAVEKSVEEVDK